MSPGSANNTADVPDNPDDGDDATERVDGSQDTIESPKPSNINHLIDVFEAPVVDGDTATIVMRFFSHLSSEKRVSPPFTINDRTWFFFFFLFIENTQPFLLLQELEHLPEEPGCSRKRPVCLLESHFAYDRLQMCLHYSCCEPIA